MCRRHVLWLVLSHAAVAAVVWLACSRPTAPRAPFAAPRPAPTQDIIVFAPGGKTSYHLRVLPDAPERPDLWEVSIMDDDRERWQTVRGVHLGARPPTP